MAYETCWLAQRKLGADVVLDRGRRRGGQGHARRFGEAFHDLGQTAVLGPELMAPVRDAVRLIHGYEHKPGGDILKDIAHE